MQIIIIGFFNEHDFQKVSQHNFGLENFFINWNHELSNLEGRVGVKTMESYFNLYKTGMLAAEDCIHYSTSIINDVKDFYCGELDQEPQLFKFIAQIEKLNIKRFILAFGDEWDENTRVIKKKIVQEDLKKELTSKSNVWTDAFLNLETGVVSVDYYHPLVLDVYCTREYLTSLISSELHKL